MFCAHCGKVINTNEKRCPFCGWQLPQQTNYHTSENNLATAGFALSVFIATTALFFNIIIYIEIHVLWAILLLCLLMIIIGVISVIICFKGYNNTKYYSLQRFAKAGIILSVLAILFTIIFMIADIVD